MGSCSRLLWRLCVIVVITVPLAGCIRATSGGGSAALEGHAGLRRQGERTDVQLRKDWLRCAALASRLLPTVRQEYRDALVSQANRCTRSYLSSIDGEAPIAYGAPHVRFAGQDFELEMRGLSPYLAPSFRFHVASDVAIPPYQGNPRPQEGFGVPVALWAQRCTDAPHCDLFPPEGVFRPATAWIEAGHESARPRLIIADADRHGPLNRGDASYPLASDHAAFYAWGTRSSPLRRLGVYGLLGGREVGRRAGLYLLEDYDPGKRPLIMIHGLGSNPLTWAKLSSAVWNDAELRDRYQVWHMVYSTDAPLLVLRRRLQQHLDHAWGVLDPEGDDPARKHAVLVGHSLGGVVARLLCADSGDALWDAAFSRPPASLDADPADIEVLLELFRFMPYDGVSHAIFMAAPHRGSPLADATLGRVFHRLVGRRAEEVHALRRVTRANPAAVREGLRTSYLNGDLNSIVTLRHSQPIRLAAESLLPAPGVSYHTIAARKRGAVPEGDGIVPLSSAVLPGAASTHIVHGGHDLHLNDEAIAEVIRLLHAL